MTLLSADALLEVRGLQTWFPIRSGVLRRVSGAVRAVDGVDLTVYPGETLALVGESGCGKTTVGRTLLRLVEATAGNIWFGGVNLTRLTGEAFRPYRQKMQIVMQDPGAALDPRLTVRDAIAEGMDAFGLGASADERTQRVADLMRRVSLDPELMWRYPHEFSGGQRQRISIARALAVEPVLLICDEATSALDVSIQAQIIALIKRLCRQRGTSVMLITHDMGVIAETADRVAVMYAGRIAEVGPVRDVVRQPHHPYTRGLMGAIPSAEAAPSARLTQIPGAMPRLTAIPQGCAFNPRCPHVFDRCKVQRPEPMPAGSSRAACWLVAHDAGARL